MLARRVDFFKYFVYLKIMNKIEQCQLFSNYIQRKREIER